MLKDNNNVRQVHTMANLITELSTWQASVGIFLVQHTLTTDQS